MADVLRRFDFGECKRHPVEVLMEDRKTPLRGSYFVWDFDSWKGVVMPDQSSKLAGRCVGYLEPNHENKG